MKQISNILLSTVLASSLANAVSFEYPQIYKNQSIMGMGGASVAAGGTAASLFSNPAGLSKIPKKYGWEVDLIDFNLSINDNIIDFSKDLDDATDKKDDNEAVLKVLENYLGENLHLNVNANFLTISKRFKNYSFAVMPISGVYSNLTPHRGGTSEGLLEANGLVYGGLALGLSKDLGSSYFFKNINVGIGAKFINYASFTTNLTVATIIDEKDDLGDYLIDDVAKKDTSFVLDLGVQADVYKNLTAGLSIMNIGSIGSDKNLTVPMTVNAGLAYTLKYDRFYVNKIVFAADYIDIFQGYEQDSDFMKRTRFGASAMLLDSVYGDFSVMAGLYQGYATYGFDLRATIFKIGYTSYAEEVGGAYGQKEDRRHMINLKIGW
ncbi:MAG: hypothetical protein HRT40_04580 [Campylobacteraceae bacterium]|nr:hypothetical protein [Campylobacteraceae bacterium]